MSTGLILSDGRDFDEAFIVTSNPNFIADGLSNDNFFISGGSKYDTCFAYIGSGNYIYNTHDNNKIITGYKNRDNVDLGSVLVRNEARPTFANTCTWLSDGIDTYNVFDFDQTLADEIGSERINIALIGGGGGGGSGAWYQYGWGGGGGAAVVQLAVPVSELIGTQIAVGYGGGKGHGGYFNPDAGTNGGYSGILKGGNIIYKAEGGNGGKGPSSSSGATGGGAYSTIPSALLKKGINSVSRTGALGIGFTINNTIDYFYELIYAGNYGKGGDGTDGTEAGDGTTGAFIIWW